MRRELMRGEKRESWARKKNVVSTLNDIEKGYTTYTLTL